MKVFLSWSGERSKAVALALRNWLPLVLHYVEPWLSQQDIAAGDRWSVEIGKELSESHFGIICLTPENLTAPWILFEAGAVSKTFSSGAVCPYLLGVEFSDIGGPLSQFQAKKADFDSTKELLDAINSRAANPLDESRFFKLYETLWPDLEKQLDPLRTSQMNLAESRPPAAVLEDLVESVRSMEGRFREVGEKLSNLESAIRPIIRYFDEANKTAFVVQFDDSVGSSNRGDKLNFLLPAAKLIQHLASHIGLDKDKYWEDWVLKDQQSGVRLSKDQILELSSKYKGSVCFLEIERWESIPF